MALSKRYISNVTAYAYRSNLSWHFSPLNLGLVLRRDSIRAMKTKRCEIRLYTMLQSIRQDPLIDFSGSCSLRYLPAKLNPKHAQRLADVLHDDSLSLPAVVKSDLLRR
jgi:hypothetical protein